MRGVASSGASVFRGGRGGCGAVRPAARRGERAGAQDAAEIGTVANVPGYIARVKTGELRLIGFGHRVYRNYGPQATLIEEMAGQVFEVTGRNPLLDIALELERIALADDYWIKGLPERGLLLGHHLPGHGLPGGDVPGAVRDRRHARLARPVAGVRSIRSRRSPGPGRFTSGRACATSTGKALTATWLELPPDSLFGVANLPCGVFSGRDGYPRLRGRGHGGDLAAGCPSDVQVVVDSPLRAAHQPPPGPATAPAPPPPADK